VTPLQASIVTLVGSGGLLLSEALDLPNMPSRSSVYRWLRDDPEFRCEYESAREQAADLLDERIDQLARSVTPANATAVRTQLAALQWRASKLNPQRYGGAGSIAIEPSEVPPADLEGARRRLMARFDAISERTESFERSHHYASSLVNAAVRALEGRQSVDVLDGADRKLILDAVERAISPPGRSQNSEPDVAEHNSVNGIGDVPSQNSEPHAGCAVPLDVEPLVSAIPAATVEVPAVPYPWDAWMMRR
jgi:hypothetical protein